MAQVYILIDVTELDQQIFHLPRKLPVPPDWKDEPEMLHRMEVSISVVDKYLQEALDVEDGELYSELKAKVPIYQWLQQNIDNQNWRDAEQAAHQVLMVHPGEPAALVYLGRIYREEDRLKDSLSSLREAHQAVGDHPWILEQLLLSLAAAGETEEHERVLHALFAAQPDNKLAVAALTERKELVMIHTDPTKPHLTRQALRDGLQEIIAEAVKTCGRDPELLARLGGMWLDDHLPRAAAIALNHAHKLDPDSTEITFALADALHRAHKDEEAESLLAPLLEAEPMLAEGWRIRGEIALQDGRAEEARQHLEQTLSLDPNNRRALDRYWRMAKESEGLEDARFYLKNMVRRQKDAWVPFVRLALDAGAQKDYEMAVVYLDQAQERGGNDPYLIETSMAIHAAAQDTDKVIKTGLGPWRKGALGPTALLQLAQAFKAQGELDDARSALKEALKHEAITPALRDKAQALQGQLAD